MRLGVRKVGTRNQLLAQAQHQSKAKSELGLELGPYAASHTASSQILSRSRPRAERAGSGERATGHREEKKGGVGTSRALQHRSAQPPESQRASILES